MAAVAVTSSGSNNQSRTGRVLLRNSSGIPYVVTNDGTNVQVFKGNSSTPTSFSEVDSANNPSTSGYGSVSAAIDSTNVIHIAYHYYNAKVSELRYVTVTALDAFSGDVSVVSDIGGDPTAITNLYTAIAIDANDKPHIAFSQYPNKGGLPSLYYINKTGASWSSAVEVEGGTNGDICRWPDITIDADNIPFIAYNNASDSAVRAAIGNFNNATSFTLTTPDVGGDFNGSCVVDSSGNHWLVYVYTGTSKLTLAKHTYGQSWTTWTTGLQSNLDTNTDGVASLVADGANIYVFARVDSSSDIAYDKYSGSSWAGVVTLETGTYNTAKAKWGFWVDNGSGGGLMDIDTASYYFDGSDALANDPNNYWTNETNADDGDTGTRATTVNTSNDTWGYLQIEGTNAPASGATIRKVQARIHNGSTWGSYLDVPSPSGGWSWIKVQALETRIACDGTFLYIYVYEDGTAGGTALAAGGGVVSDVGGVDGVSKVEILVTAWDRISASSLDYCFTDETATPDIQWNVLSLSSSSGTNMKLNIGDSWKTVDSLKVNIGDSWKTVTSAKVNIGDSWKTIF